MPGVLPTMPSASAIRAELEQMVVADLLGPAGGPDEEIEEGKGSGSDLRTTAPDLFSLTHFLPLVRQPDRQG
jgi:hypothetical protein